jgi:ubiquinone/menaquinone biosynthesis C-methylase UbiE
MRGVKRPAGPQVTPNAPPQTQGRMIRWARLYDLGTTLLSFGRASVLRRRTVELAGIARGERILDVGCGPGRLAILAGTVAGPGGEAYGIDPAPEMIALARRNAAGAGVGVRFDVGLIEALPYPDNHFDVVLSSLMLHHLPDELKRRGFTEVRRVLKPAGRFVAVDFGATPGERFGHLLCVLGLRRGRDHAERLREMLREAAFDTVEMGSTGHRALAFVRAWKPARDQPDTPVSSGK